MAQKTSNHRPGLLDRLLRIERSESHDHIESEVVELQNVSIGSVDAQKATFVYGLAQRFGLGGFVFNDSDGVTLEIEGSVSALDAFEQTLRSAPPPLARIDAVIATTVAPRGETSFHIETSRAAAARNALSCSIRMTGASVTRLSTARIAVRDSQLCSMCRMTGRRRRCASFRCARHARRSMMIP
jgi:acylphosphatase